MKRLLTFLLAVMTAGHCLAYNFEVDGIYYNVLTEIDKTVETTDCNLTGTVSIPDSVVYNGVQYSVSGIGEETFYGKDITNIYLNRISYIGKKAFCNSNVKRINMPSSISSVGDSAFCDCTCLQTVTLSENLTEISSSAFRNCSILNNINLHEGIMSIHDHAFSCTPISGIVIPTTLTNINETSFVDCNYLKDITCLSTDPVIYGKCFGNDVTIHVLKGTKSKYENSTYWNKYVIEENAIDIDEANDNFSVIDVYGKIENGTFIGFNNEDVWTWKKLLGKMRLVRVEKPSESAMNNNGWYRIVDYNKGLYDKNCILQGNYIIRYVNTFNDGESYANSKSMTLPNMVYKRKFNNNQWQSLYVPFSLSIDDLKSRGITIAELNDTHQKDNNSDGIADETEVEFFTLPTGYTKPNHPYLIRAEYNTEISMSMSNVELSPSAENYIDCSTTKQTFTFCGTYSGVTGAEMYSNHYYGMSGGALQRAANSSVSLKSQRWYMKIENRDGSDVAYYAPSLRMIIDGIEDETTGLLFVRHDENNNDSYNLNGIKKCNHETNLFHIKNGHKILIK